MFDVSQWAAEKVVREMREGSAELDQFVEQFWVDRPEWLENDQQDETTGQANGKQAEGTKGA
jgi:hypothetical protein